jgi:hypothetical protein
VLAEIETRAATEGFASSKLVVMPQAAQSAVAPTDSNH